MAQVWSARRQTPGGPKHCAVKIIRPDRAADPGYREMFQREARLTLALSGHGNVVSVFDVGEHEGRSYLAMELVDGVTLAELARQVGKPWSVARAVYVVAGVLRALCHIHAHAVDGQPQGIVHRDVTPHNVMVSARGEIKLVDFGIAQRADAEPCLGGALGRLAYVPREQAEGDADQRADLYSAGAILFELLDGRRFRWHCADEDAYFIEVYRNRVPTLSRKDVPPAVNAVLRGLLQPDRARRIPTAAEALRQLEAWPDFHWAITELEALYAETIGPRASPSTSLPPAPLPPAPMEVPRAPSSLPARPRRRASDSPRGRRPWEDSRPPSTAIDDDAEHWAQTLPHVAADSPSGSFEGPTFEARGHETTPAPRGPLDRSAELLATRALPEAERNPDLSAEPLDRLVTRRHPAAPVERDIPSARASAEIAVTKAQPSLHAPWAAGTDPIVQRLVRSEPGAPVKRHRASTSDPLGERTGSVAPRARESAAIHRAAKGGKPGVVTGEIVTDDGLGSLGKPVWRVGSR